MWELLGIVSCSAEDGINSRRANDAQYGERARSGIHWPIVSYSLVLALCIHVKLSSHLQTMQRSFRGLVSKISLPHRCSIASAVFRSILSRSLRRDRQ